MSNWDDWLCPCDVCMGIAEPPGYMDDDYDEIVSRDNGVVEEEESGSEEYFCGSNYCDDPACIYPHPEVL